MQSFVAFKKLVALVLLLILVVIGVVAIWDAFSNGGGLVGCFRAFYSSFFTSFYTILIFADVLVVLASLRYSKAYDFAFRYFGFTVATVMIRLALTAPRFIDAAIGVGTMLFCPLSHIGRRSSLSFLSARRQRPARTGLSRTPGWNQVAPWFTRRWR